MHRKNYGMATIVSVVFKVVAWLWILGALIAAANAQSAANDLGANSTSQGAVVFVILAGGAVLACTTAFFGYVISLLRDIARNGETRQGAYDTVNIHVPSHAGDAGRRLGRPALGLTVLR